MLAKKKPVDEELSEEESAERYQDKLVDPMTTSLGIEDELEPFPGPPVPSEIPEVVDDRPIFLCLSLYQQGMMPSDDLQAAYFAWLSSVKATTDIGLCLAQYMLRADTFNIDELYGEPMTEDELLAAESAAEDSAESAPQLEMRPMPYVAGNCHVVKAASREEVLSWLESDPIAAVDGYERQAVHLWGRVDEPALNVQLMPPQGYAVYCVDQPGKAAVRAATRSAHLKWLEESGRVHLAGPLLSAEDDTSALGSFLIVNGDDSDEVSRWAAKDPYAAAKLFDNVFVAPLLNYAVQLHPIPLCNQPLEAVSMDEQEVVV